MSTDNWANIREEKDRNRARIAAMEFSEKIRLLDSLRERERQMSSFRSIVRVATYTSSPTPLLSEPMAAVTNAGSAGRLVLLGANPTLLSFMTDVSSTSVPKVLEARAESQKST